MITHDDIEWLRAIIKHINNRFDEFEESAQVLSEIGTLRMRINSDLNDELDAFIEEAKSSSKKR